MQTPRIPCVFRVAIGGARQKRSLATQGEACQCPRQSRRALRVRAGRGGRAIGVAPDRAARWRALHCAIVRPARFPGRRSGVRPPAAQRAGAVQPAAEVEWRAAGPTQGLTRYGRPRARRLVFLFFFAVFAMCLRGADDAGRLRRSEHVFCGRMRRLAQGCRAYPALAPPSPPRRVEGGAPRQPPGHAWPTGAAHRCDRRAVTLNAARRRRRLAEPSSAGWPRRLVRRDRFPTPMPPAAGPHQPNR